MDYRDCHEWFVNIWNYDVVPRFKKMIASSSRQPKPIDDPINWIISTYPWPNCDTSKISRVVDSNMSKSHESDVIAQQLVSQQFAFWIK